MSKSEVGARVSSLLASAIIISEVDAHLSSLLTSPIVIKSGARDSSLPDDKLLISAPNARDSSLPDLGEHSDLSARDSSLSRSIKFTSSNLFLFNCQLVFHF